MRYRLLKFAIILAGQPAYAALPPTLWTISLSEAQPAIVAAVPSGGIAVASTAATGRISRYDQHGVLLWQRVIGASSTNASAITVDLGGNFYVAGQTYTALHGSHIGAADLYVRKYDSSGVLLWGTQYGTPQFDGPSGIAVGTGGASYVTNGPWTTNYGTPPPGLVTTLRSLDELGSLRWAATLDIGDGAAPGNTSRDAAATAIGGSGNIFSVYSNYFRDAQNVFYSRNYLAKTDPDGAVIWNRRIDDGSNILGAIADAEDNVYIADGLLSKYDSAGSLLWRRTFPNVSVNAVSRAPDGRVWTSGFRSNQGYLCEIDPATGMVIWSGTIAGPTTRMQFHSLTYSNGQLVVSGHLVTGNTWSGNRIYSFAVPEPFNWAFLALLPLVMLRRNDRERASKTSI